jgi:hypothetical protein
LYLEVKDLKQLVTILALLALAAPHIVTAQNVQPETVRAMGVDASAPQWCAVTSAGRQPDAAAAGRNTIGPIGADVRIVDLVDPTTLSTRAARTIVGFEAACNYPHRLTVRSQNNGLRRGAGATGQGIALAVPYTASLNWGELGISFFADAQSPIELARVGTSAGAVAGPLTVQVDIQAGATNLGPNSPLGAGEYSDVISIEMGPL